MTHDDVQRWLDRYIAAWRSYDANAIGDLFATNATYRYHPWDEEALEGRDAIVAAWLEDPDDPARWSAWYKPFAVEGDRAVAIGESRYTNPDGSLRDLYFNTWLVRFDADGRCTEFVEYFAALPNEEKGRYA